MSRMERGCRFLTGSGQCLPSASSQRHSGVCKRSLQVRRWRTGWSCTWRSGMVGRVGRVSSLVCDSDVFETSGSKLVSFSYLSPEKMIPLYSSLWVGNHLHFPNKNTGCKTFSHLQVIPRLDYFLVIWRNMMFLPECLSRCLTGTPSPLITEDLFCLLRSLKG